MVDKEKENTWWGEKQKFWQREERGEEKKELQLQSAHEAKMPGEVEIQLVQEQTLAGAQLVYGSATKVVCELLVTVSTATL